MHLADDPNWCDEDFICIEDAEVETLKEALTKINRMIWDETWLQGRLTEKLREYQGLPTLAGSSRTSGFHKLKFHSGKRIRDLGHLGSRLAAILKEKEEAAEKVKTLEH